MILVGVGDEQVAQIFVMQVVFGPVEHGVRTEVDADLLPQLISGAGAEILPAVLPRLPADLAVAEQGGHGLAGAASANQKFHGFSVFFRGAFTSFRPELP